MISDLATEMAESLKKQYQLEQGFDPSEKLEDTGDVRAFKKMFSRMSYSWEPQDKAVLMQIESASQSLVQEMFQYEIEIIDDLYSTLKVPRWSKHNTVMKDQEGRIVWEKDSEGRDIEDWSQVTGQDIELALLRLQNLSVGISQQVQQLFLEASFARMVSQDEWDDAYREVVDGTISDRTSRANSVTRKERYLAFFRYCLWSQSDAFQKEVKALTRLLERIMEWRIRREK